LFFRGLAESISCLLHIRQPWGRRSPLLARLSLRQKCTRMDVLKCTLQTGVGFLSNQMQHTKRGKLPGLEVCVSCVPQEAVYLSGNLQGMTISYEWCRRTQVSSCARAMTMWWRWLTVSITSSRVPRHCRGGCDGSTGPGHTMCSVLARFSRPPNACSKTLASWRSAASRPSVNPS